MLDFPNGDTKFSSVPAQAVSRSAAWIRSLILMYLIHLSPQCGLLLVGRGLRKQGCSARRTCSNTPPYIWFLVGKSRKAAPETLMKASH